MLSVLLAPPRLSIPRTNVWAQRGREQPGAQRQGRGGAGRSPACCSPEIRGATGEASGRHRMDCTVHPVTRSEGSREPPCAAWELPDHRTARVGLPPTRQLAFPCAPHRNRALPISASDGTFLAAGASEENCSINGDFRIPRVSPCFPTSSALRYPSPSPCPSYTTCLKFPLQSTPHLKHSSHFSSHPIPDGFSSVNSHQLFPIHHPTVWDGHSYSSAKPVLVDDRRVPGPILLSQSWPQPALLLSACLESTGPPALQYAAVPT